MFNYVLAKHYNPNPKFTEKTKCVKSKTVNGKKEESTKHESRRNTLSAV
jgi:hypothetical protein